jgi:hypothetical protein
MEYGMCLLTQSNICNKNNSNNQCTEAEINSIKSKRPSRYGKKIVDAIMGAFASRLFDTYWTFHDLWSQSMVAAFVVFFLLVVSLASTSPIVGLETMEERRRYAPTVSARSDVPRT